MPTLDLLFSWTAPLAEDLDLATSSVMLTSLSIHPPRPTSPNPLSLLWTALANAKKRGIIVDVIIPAVSKSHPATAFNYAAADTLHAMGATVHFAPPMRLLHAKTVVIDARIVWVGSGNWTAAAAAHNHEAYIRCDAPQLAAQMRQHWTSMGLIHG